MATSLLNNGQNYPDGQQIPTTATGVYTYANGGSFVVYSDTAGLVTGTTVSNNVVTQYVPVGGITRIALKSVDLATTRAAMAIANLVACPTQ